MAQFLHTRIRIGDIDRTVAFYEPLGFKVRSRNDKSPAGNKLVFLELPGSSHALELCFSPDYVPEVPEDLMHIAIGYPDLIAKCDALEKLGYAIWPADWRTKLPTGRKMAFVTDPDGYEVELLERA